MTTLLTPIDLSAGRQTGPRVFRKQVLEKRTIDYKGRQITFDDAYLTDLAESFNAGAYDLVPFQLADPHNAHNEDPRNFGGVVKALEVTPDGLDAIIELSDEAAKLVDLTGGKLGVSARIKEALTHVDGRSFKRAVRHVLGTLDPRMQGMRGWEPVDLSTDDPGELIDLSGYDYQGEGMARRIDLSHLSDDQMEELESAAAVLGIPLSVDLSAEDDSEPDEGDESDEPFEFYDEADEQDEDEPADEVDEDEPADGEQTAQADTLEPLSDAELDAMLDEAIREAGIDVQEPAAVSLSNEDGDDEGQGNMFDSLDLAAGLAGESDDTAQVARRDAAAARYELAAERYGNAGVPPYLLDLARPVLELSDDSDVLELSSPATGEAIDVRGIVTKMLDAFAGTVDLSAELGRGHEDTSGQAADDTARAWTDYLENN